MYNNYSLRINCNFKRYYRYKTDCLENILRGNTWTIDTEKSILKTRKRLRKDLEALVEKYF